MPDLTREQTLEFLRAWPAQIAHVSTVRPDGTTATVPVWFRIDAADDLLIWTSHHRKWVQRVATSGHLSVTETNHQWSREHSVTRTFRTRT